MNGEGVCLLSEKLYLIYTFVKITINDVNIIKVKRHDQKPRDKRQFYNWTPYFIKRLGYLFHGVLIGLWHKYLSKFLPHSLHGGIYFLQFFNARSYSPNTFFKAFQIILIVTGII